MWRERNKTQHRAAFAVHIDSIVQIELIEIHRNARQGAHKAVGQQGYIVLENVDFAHEVVKHFLDVFLVDALIDTGIFSA